LVRRPSRPAQHAEAFLRAWTAVLRHGRGLAPFTVMAVFLCAGSDAVEAGGRNWAGISRFSRSGRREAAAGSVGWGSSPVGPGHQTVKSRGPLFRLGPLLRALGLSCGAASSGPLPVLPRVRAPALTGGDSVSARVVAVWEPRGRIGSGLGKGDGEAVNADDGRGAASARVRGGRKGGRLCGWGRSLRRRFSDR
jgi:hypothetical protein